MRTYLLTDEPWIPCERPDGTRIELGLREVFRQAHELGALSDPSPLVTGSLLRLLLAILHRCFGPATEDDWIELYEAARFDAARTDAYFDTWQRRFDLFAPERPFYQTRGLPYEAKHAAQLVAERSNYGASVHVFEHRPSNASGALTPAEAARALVAAQAFRPGGLVSRGPGEPPSAAAAPLNAAALVVIRGKSLFETLLLNALVYNPAENAPIPAVRGADRPAWEQDEPAAVGKRVPSGWLDLLTWQSRRIELGPSENGERVQTYILAGGWDLDAATRDPMVAYRRSEKLGLRPLRIEEARAVWRDAHAFICAANENMVKLRPDTIEQLCNPAIKQTVPPGSRYVLDVLGVAGEKASIKLTRAEGLPVSPRLLADADLGNLVKAAVEETDQTADALRRALYTAMRHVLSTGERQPAGEDIHRLINASGGVRELWGQLAGPFMQLLGKLAEGNESAIGDYRSEVRHIAFDVLHQAVASFGDTARVLKGQTLAAATLGSALGKLFSKQLTGKENQ